MSALRVQSCSPPNVQYVRARRVQITANKTVSERASAVACYPAVERVAISSGARKYGRFAITVKANSMKISDCCIYRLGRGNAGAGWASSPLGNRFSYMSDRSRSQHRFAEVEAPCQLDRRGRPVRRTRCRQESRTSDRERGGARPSALPKSRRFNIVALTGSWPTTTGASWAANSWDR
jgi:hypothetical protein